jgi:peroxiredoxin
MKQLATTIFFVSLVFMAFAQEKPEGLFLNSKAPDFKAVDQNGQVFNLKDIRKKKKVVLLFYQGNWSPFCNRELKRFQDSLQLISDKGAQLIAVTAESKTGIDSTIVKTGAIFPIFFDKDLTITTNYNGSYQVDERSIGRYKNAGIDLLKLNQQRQPYLPVPAVYIIDNEGNITYRFFEDDYKKRPSVKEILQNLR